MTPNTELARTVKTLQDTGTVYKRPKIWIFNFPR